MRNLDKKTKSKFDVSNETNFQTINKKALKKFILIVIVPLLIIGNIGIILLAVGCELPMLSLAITGWVLVAIGYIPLVIICIIIAYKRGVMWTW